VIEACHRHGRHASVISKRKPSDLSACKWLRARDLNPRHRGIVDFG
jgi:hypothetical protein